MGKATTGGGVDRCAREECMEEGCAWEEAHMRRGVWGKCLVEGGGGMEEVWIETEDVHMEERRTREGVCIWE